MRLSPRSEIRLFMAAAVGLSGCLLSGGKNPEPKGTEVENEVSGLLYLVGGKPADGARVRIYPVDWNPSDS